MRLFFLALQNKTRGMIFSCLFCMKLRYINGLAWLAWGVLGKQCNP